MKTSENNKKRVSSRAQQGRALRSREISIYSEKDLSASAALRLSVEMTHSSMVYAV
jgi:hypothetical protein